jgi:ribosomal protein S14
MKKIIIKDKKLREILHVKEKTNFVLKLIINNSNLLKQIRWKAIKILKDLANNRSKAAITYRCRETINKKRFNKYTLNSRHLFLKSIRFGLIHGIQKACW